MFNNRQILIFVNAYIEYATILGFLVGCYGFKKNKSIHPIIYLLLFTFLNYQVLLYGDFPTRSVFHVFNPIQLLFLGWFFYLNVEGVKMKRAILFILSAAIAFAFVNVFFLQSITEYPSNFIMVETLLLIIGATFLFVEKLDAPAKENVFTDPVFLVTSGILCFNIFSFIFFLLTSYFEKHKIDQFGSIYKILYFANIIYYALLFVACFYSIKKNTSIAKS